jgi:hypothetical protein
MPFSISDKGNLHKRCSVLLDRELTGSRLPGPLFSVTLPRMAGGMKAA